MRVSPLTTGGGNRSRLLYSCDYLRGVGLWPVISDAKYSTRLNEYHCKLYKRMLLLWNQGRTPYVEYNPDKPQMHQCFRQVESLHISPMRCPHKPVSNSSSMWCMIFAPLDSIPTPLALYTLGPNQQNDWYFPDAIFTFVSLTEKIDLNTDICHICSYWDQLSKSTTVHMMTSHRLEDPPVPEAIVTLLTDTYRFHQDYVKILVWKNV